MTDETKKLFSAPWQIWGDGCQVCDIRGTERAYCEDIKDSARFARLPELYDALVETVYYKCFECMGGLRHNIEMTREEIIKNGCPKQNKSNVCIYVKHLELLRKVRDGE